MLSYTDPEGARALLDQAQQDVAQRWDIYSTLRDRYPAAAVRGLGSPGSHVEAAAEPALAGQVLP
jgi:hypothetical protein